MSQEIIEKIKQAIEGYKDDTKWEEIGKVSEVGDGIAKVSGLTNVQSQEVLTIETEKEKIKAVALNLEEDSVGVLILGDGSLVKSGQTVKRTKQILSIPVGEQYDRDERQYRHQHFSRQWHRYERTGNCC